MSKITKHTLLYKQIDLKHDNKFMIRVKTNRQKLKKNFENFNKQHLITQFWTIESIKIFREITKDFRFAINALFDHILIEKNDFITIIETTRNKKICDKAISTIDETLITFFSSFIFTTNNLFALFDLVSQMIKSIIDMTNEIDQVFLFQFSKNEKYSIVNEIENEIND